MNQEHKTATGYTTTEEWEVMNKKIDWMMAPTMAEYVNGMVSEKPLNNGGHWAVYAKDKFVMPLFQKKRRLSMVSLACGSGHIEESLIKDFNWPISRFVGLEYDDSLRINAAERFKSIPTCDTTISFFDFNNFDYNGEQFDIVFACHSLHHSNDIEGLVKAIQKLLKPDGIVIGIDYFGPTRFQIEYNVLPIIKELFGYLSDNLRRNLLTPEMKVDHKFNYDNFDTVARYDISEAVRSSDLRTLLFSAFPIVEIKPMGGTILRWLLQHRAGNFIPSNPDHVTIIRLLQFIEKELITHNRINSDDLFFCLKKSEIL